MTDLSGKIALITGASRGIGAATAKLLAKSGATIGLNHFADEQSAQSIADEIVKNSGRAEIFACDVSNTDAVSQMVERINQRLGPIDILINNAGINDDSAVWKMSEEQWDRVIAVNLKGCFNTIRAVAPNLRASASGYGRIVNISSINGMRGKFGLSNYSASKAGIIGLTKSVARELGKYQVTVNAVAPGFILTDMMKGLPEKINQAAKDETALGRLGEPEDVASVIAFLCSESARHITGGVIKVDGGQYI